MTRLEKYKNILIPVDDVAYVEYKKSDKDSWDEEGGTYIRVRNGAFFNPIKISKRNVLDDFKKWYDETMKRIGNVETSPNYGWTICTTTGTSEEKSFDISPTATWVQHDGMEHPL